MYRNQRKLFVLPIINRVFFSRKAIKSFQNSEGVGKVKKLIEESSSSDLKSVKDRIFEKMSSRQTNSENFDFNASF